jgi:hypothetical protein
MSPRGRKQPRQAATGKGRLELCHFGADAAVKPAVEHRPGRQIESRTEHRYSRCE